MRTIDVIKTTDTITAFIKETLTRTRFSEVVVGISGGVDSALATSLAAKAIGASHVHALLLPYKNWHDEHKTHARLLLNNLKIPAAHIHEINIAPMVETFIKELGINNHESRENKVRIGNLMARCRMIALFDFAKKLPGLVLGTENKSEHYLGYFTRFGDEASDIEPIRGLYKTEVYKLAEYLNLPQEILTKAPTAGLWLGQSDESQFGFSYKEADQVLWGLFEAKLSVEELIKQGLSKDVINRVSAWVKQVEFKNHLPYVAPEPIVKP